MSLLVSLCGWKMDCTILSFNYYTKSQSQFLWEEVRWIKSVLVTEWLLINDQAILTNFSSLSPSHTYTFPSFSVDSWGRAYFDQADIHWLWRISVRTGGDLDAVHRVGVSSWSCSPAYLQYQHGCLCQM